jgi:mannose-6-phosphate isomerase-like protein (cupin superfamily)
MNKIRGTMFGIVVSGLMITAEGLSPVVAQAKDPSPATIKVLLENDKVKVTETTYKPGDVNMGVVTSATRVIRTLKGGTLVRTYDDGKTETVVLKAEQIQYLEAGPHYTTKNVGKTEIKTYAVQLK